MWGWCRPWIGVSDTSIIDRLASMYRSEVGYARSEISRRKLSCAGLAALSLLDRSRRQGFTLVAALCAREVGLELGGEDHLLQCAVVSFPDHQVWSVVGRVIARADRGPGLLAGETRPRSSVAAGLVTGVLTVTAWCFDFDPLRGLRVHGDAT